jgi:hypothetical protein
VIAVLLVVASGVAAWYFVRRQPATITVTGTRWQVPTEITPFSALTLLKNIQQKTSLQGSAASDLASSIERIERWYFAGSTSTAPQPDLQSEVTGWIHRASS